MKIGDESILFFSRVSLSKFSLEAFMGKMGIYTGVRMECEESGFSKQGWRVAWLSHEFQSRGNWTANCPILSSSAPVGVTLQLLACLARVQLLAACSRESPTRSNRESLFFLHTLEHFFTLSHSLPLQESHLNTRLLIAEIQANLTRNKANKLVNKIQPYNLPLWLFCDKTLKQTLDLTCELGIVEHKLTHT